MVLIVFITSWYYISVNVFMLRNESIIFTCHFALHMVWWSGVVVSTLALFNEVNLRRTRLVLRFPVPDLYFNM